MVVSLQRGSKVTIFLLKKTIVWSSVTTGWWLGIAPWLMKPPFFRGFVSPCLLIWNHPGKMEKRGKHTERHQLDGSVTTFVVHLPMTLFSRIGSRFSMLQGKITPYSQLKIVFEPTFTSSIYNYNPLINPSSWSYKPAIYPGAKRLDVE